MNTEAITEEELEKIYNQTPAPTVAEENDAVEIENDSEDSTEFVQTAPEEEEPVNSIQEFMQRRNQAIVARTAAVASLAGKKKFSRGDLVKVFTAFSRENEVTEQLCSMLLNDSFQLSLANAQMQQQMFQLGQTNALLKMTLVDRPTPTVGEPIITQEDIDKTWNEKLKPQLEARIKEEQEKANPSGLVTPDGIPVEQAK